MSVMNSYWLLSFRIPLYIDRVITGLLHTGFGHTTYLPYTLNRPSLLLGINSESKLSTSSLVMVVGLPQYGHSHDIGFMTEL